MRCSGAPIMAEFAIRACRLQTGHAHVERETTDLGAASRRKPIHGTPFNRGQGAKLRAASFCVVRLEDPTSRPSKRRAHRHGPAADVPRRPPRCRMVGDGDIEITRQQNRNYCIAEGFRRIAKESNAIGLMLRYRAQAEREYRRAVEDFDRLKALRHEMPNEPDSALRNKANGPYRTNPTRARTRLPNRDRTRQLHRRIRHQLIQHILRHQRIRRNHRDRFQRFARIAAAQREIRDIDAVRAEHRAHMPDHARHIQVLHAEPAVRPAALRSRCRPRASAAACPEPPRLPPWSRSNPFPLRAGSYPNAPNACRALRPRSSRARPRSASRSPRSPCDRASSGSARPPGPHCAAGWCSCPRCCPK